MRYPGPPAKTGRNDAIRLAYKAGATQADLAREHGVTYARIGQIVHVSPWRRQAEDRRTRMQGRWAYPMEPQDMTRIHWWFEASGGVDAFEAL